MDFKNTLTFEDATRLNGPLAFNAMVKPAGSLCNLDCRYCYYLDKAEIYSGLEPRMSVEELEKFIKAYIGANEVPVVNFTWHGGEPLVMGLDFYRTAVRLQQKYAAGKTITNSLQTNGTLINEDFARFFKDNGFLIGISIDGPEDIHDKNRKDKGGAPTFERVMRGIERLYRHGVEYNTMSTINHNSEGQGARVYNFLKGLGTRYMQFMPVVEHVKYPLKSSGVANKAARPYIVDPSEEGAVLAPWSVGSRAFGEFMCDIFDLWVKQDVGRYFVNLFDCALACWCGAQPGTCVYGETCGGNSIVEHNGDLYCCDHFVYPKYKLGNVFTDDVGELMRSPAQVKFGMDKRNGLPRKCLSCRWYFACHGECPKHRFATTDQGEKGLCALCEGYTRFFSHIAPYMDRMKELLLEGKAPAGIMLENITPAGTL